MKCISKVLTISLAVSSMLLQAACNKDLQNYNKLSPADKKITETQADEFAKQKIDLQKQNQIPPSQQQSQSPKSSLTNSSCKYAVVPPDQATPYTISLTFDDGINPNTTPLVLDVLKAHNIKVTFFILGSKIRGNESLIERMKSEGHHIANHSWDHPNFHLLTPSQAQSQINRTEALLIPFIGDETKYFRYPYGNSNCETNDFLSSEGYKKVGWHIDSCDWAFADGKITDKENITCEATEAEKKDFITYVLNHTKSKRGGILLMHDIHMKTAMNLDEIISRLTQLGFQFVDLADTRYFPNLNK